MSGLRWKLNWDYLALSFCVMWSGSLVDLGVSIQVRAPTQFKFSIKQNATCLILRVVENSTEISIIILRLHITSHCVNAFATVCFYHFLEWVTNVHTNAHSASTVKRVRIKTVFEWFRGSHFYAYFLCVYMNDFHIKMRRGWLSIGVFDVFV